MHVSIGVLLLYGPRCARMFGLVVCNSAVSLYYTGCSLFCILRPFSTPTGTRVCLVRDRQNNNRHRRPFPLLRIFCRATAAVPPPMPIRKHRRSTFFHFYYRHVCSCDRTSCSAVCWPPYPNGSRSIGWSVCWAFGPTRFRMIFATSASCVM